uniref:Alpha-conotoxin QcIA n=2 Tax=Conus TaxID=6490 RepID=CA1A_CONQU|nr:RecName: Full=Alpha-conotoxin QcIA; AltName: Full=A superfamily conotoxin Qc1.11; AltName: Full=A superfamily conotoxin Qc1.16; AltName: Full=Alpha4/7-conotoxin QuIA; Flags: Precursor [Conus quercinus]AGK23171.1 A superfamily conotoxin Eb1.2 precursor [Conus ebraeus]AGK23189.1 A superfamily conotoxin Qc1.11 precursor [Conus quercinus]
MGMRMMFTLFLLAVLSTTVVSFTLDRASNGRDAAADSKAADQIAQTVRDECCSNPSCAQTHPEICRRTLMLQNPLNHDMSPSA